MCMPGALHTLPCPFLHRELSSPAHQAASRPGTDSNPAPAVSFLRCIMTWRGAHSLRSGVEEPTRYLGTGQSPASLPCDRMRQGASLRPTLLLGSRLELRLEVSLPLSLGASMWLHRGRAAPREPCQTKT